MSSMCFSQYVKVDDILKFIQPKLSALLQNSPYGIIIDIKKNKRTRTDRQNKYLWAIYKNIVEFYEKTGFIPDNLPLNRINSDFLHEYFKALFDVPTSRTLSTKEFCEYTDKIQLLMTEQTKGEYDPIYPEEPFAEM